MNDPLSDPDVPLGSSGEDDVDALAADVEAALGEEAAALRRDFEELNDRHLRLAAEFNNYRRRVEQERLDLWPKAQGEVLARFLDVLDDLQRVAAMDLSNATTEAILQGIDLVERKLVRKLAEAGLETVDPVGLRFDPATMEAIVSMPAPSPDADEQVAQVFQKGYTLRGQLLRPARVGVHKHEG